MPPCAQTKILICLNGMNGMPAAQAVAMDSKVGHENVTIKNVMAMSANQKRIVIKEGKAFQFKAFKNESLII